MSNCCVLETNARKGLWRVSKRRTGVVIAIGIGLSHNNEETVESVENEEALKAGHCVDPFRGMQLWAAAAGMIVKTATTVRRAVEASDAISVAFPVAPRELKIKEGFQNAQWCLGKTEGLGVGPGVDIKAPGRLPGLRDN